MNFFTKRNSLPIPKTKQSAQGYPKGLWSNTFLATTVIEAFINMGLEAYVFYAFFRQLNLDNTTARTIPTYLAIYIFAFVFQIWLAITAVVKRNTIQVIGLVIFNFAFLVYSAFQIREAHNVVFGTNTDFDQHGDVFNTSSNLRLGAANHQTAREHFWHHLLPFLVIVPCIIAVAQVLYVICALKLYQVFGWDIYQKLGASTTVKNYFMSYQIFVVLLTYDWFFFGGFVVQLLILFVDSTDWTFWVTVAALPTTLIGLLAAGYAVRHELKWLLIAFDVCLTVALTYFCYEIWVIYFSKHADTYQNDRITLGIFAGISIVLLVMTFINSVTCQTYFGKADLWSRTRNVSVDDNMLLSDMETEHNQTKRVLLD
ncbi:Putative uncharacterized protein [Taphrina deformans PYCC 5710]|uniref:Uncharacterized protein n=1 Tax=Taphrina deformans (strain PYCC 5710 / ATCC 11124 / CBS 356.35 / IMI 108563 / JCM 9778 / NBRC 8474) TaxID=1097556 RepID=R4X7Q4_TAPDE|nr:Putative uncharacterized protein [Taphrina deformans PYCC 5710]|eukprot:CCG81476.1 Putative uncharacterized protein [Taphrina deformans PYCC 5710]